MRPCGEGRGLVGVEAVLDRQRSDLESDGDPLLGPRHLLDPAPEHLVPEMALERREVERAELAAEPGEGAAEVGRVVGQVGHQAPRVRPFQSRLGLGPAAPALAEDSLLGLRPRPVGRVRLGEGQPEGPLVVAPKPRPRDELAAGADRAEPLVVEVVRQAVAGQRGEPGQGAFDRRGGQVAEHHDEPIAAELARAIGRREPAERLEVEARLVQRPVGSVDDGQVLDRLRVPILQAAVADPPSRQVPAPADGLDGLERSHPALGQPVENETALVTGSNQRKFLDLEIVGLAFELHRWRRGDPHPGGIGRTRAELGSARDPRAPAPHAYHLGTGSDDTRCPPAITTRRWRW